MQQAEVGPSSASYGAEDAGPSAGLQTRAMAQNRIPKDFIPDLESDESSSRNLAYRRAFLKSAYSRGPPAYWQIAHVPEELNKMPIRALGGEDIRSRIRVSSDFLNESIVSVRKRHLQAPQTLQEQQRAHTLLARPPVIIEQQLYGQVFFPSPAIASDSFACPGPPPPSLYTLISNPKTTKKEPRKVLRAVSRVAKGLPVLNRTVSFCKKLRGKVSELVGSASSLGECVACMEQFKNSKLVSLACHNYCKICFATLVSASLASEDQWPVKCCTVSIPSSDVLRHISKRQQKKFLQREIEWSTPVDERIYCAANTCGRFIPRSAIRKNKTCVRCRKCRTNVCTQCLGLWHGKDDCPNEVGLQEALALAESQGWKRCPKCRAMVSRNQGCRIIHCRCGGHFCYLCGNYCLRYGGCGCDIDAGAAAMAAQQADAQAESQSSSEASSTPSERTASTSSQETHGAEEIERARIAYENYRNHQIAEKAMAIQRKHAVEKKELDGIHQEQRQLIYARWNRQEKQLSDDRQDAINRLIARAQRSLNFATKLAYLQNFYENSFSMEEKIMIAEGKAAWPDFNRQMISSIPNPYSEKEITKAKKEIRMQKEGNLGTMEKQIEKYNEEARKLVKEASQARNKTRVVLNTIFQEYERGLSRIQAAEAGWMDAVMAERHSMLREMQNGEIAHARRNPQELL